MPEFYRSHTITQYAEHPDVDVSWSNNAKDTTIESDPNYNLGDFEKGAGNKNVISTIKPLRHISNSTRGPILDKTYYLKCVDFRVDPEDVPYEITGITLYVDAQKNGRIVDETIVMVYQGEVISESKVDLQALREGHLKSNTRQIYGGEVDLWSASLTRDMLLDPTFGFLLRYKSHPFYPHEIGMQFNQIMMSIHPFNYFTFDDDISVKFITEDSPADYFVGE